MDVDNKDREPPIGLHCGKAESWGVALIAAGMVSLNLFAIAWSNNDGVMGGIVGVPLSLFVMFAGGRIWRDGGTKL